MNDEVTSEADDSDPWPDQEHVSRESRSGLIRELWSHPWGRVFMVAITIATVSWALRETAIVTLPVVDAVAQVVLPLAIGFTIAYILNPVVDLLQRPLRYRVVAACVLYVVLSVISGLTIALVVPSITQQSTELAIRTFQDQPYLDIDGDQTFDRLEPRLTAIHDEPGWYWHDRDGNGQADDDEPRYRVDDHPVQVARSLSGAVVGWMQDQEQQVDRLMGLKLGPPEQAFLTLYYHRTATVRAILDAAAQVAREQQPLSTWPAALQIDVAQLPSLPVGWDRAWPGVDTETVDSLAAGLAEPSRQQWIAAVDWYGRLYMAMHRSLLGDWDRVRGRQQFTVSIDVPAEPVPAQVAALYAEARAVHEVDMVTELQREVQRSGGEADAEIVAFIAVLERDEQTGASFAVSLLQRLRDDELNNGSMMAQQFIDRIGESLRSGIEQASASAGDYVTKLVTNFGGLLSFALDVILVPIYAFFLSLVMPGIRRQVRRYLPTSIRERTVRILHDIEKVVAAFFRGRLIVCVLCAILVWVGFAVIGVPYAALFGICIGLATAVPLSGLLFLIPACLLMMVEGGDSVMWQIIAIIAVYTVVQTLEMTVFTPTIMGHEVELHPVTLIVALVLCGKLLGILGLILAVPIAATVRILLREFVLQRLRQVADVPPTMMIKRADLEASGMRQANPNDPHDTD